MNTTRWQPTWQNQPHLSQTMKPMKKPKRRKPKRQEGKEVEFLLILSYIRHLYTNFTWIHVDYLFILFYVELQVQVTWCVY